MSEALTSETLTDANMTRESLQGWVPALASEEELRAALEQAFDYRGDITLTLKSGEAVQGYLYDRRMGKSLAESQARVLTTEGARRDVAYAEIAALNFSGRDTAAGKTWESWVKKYAEKKAAGETNIGLEPDEQE
ncbi:MAG: hypothetical protein P4M01_06345 [Acidobacteriota bacterium]|nr:hypothetical protein [Acidobacteriota bacterium]